MKKILMTLFCMIIMSMIFAAGTVETPEEYVDLGIMEVPEEGYYAIIRLPYIKPAGINTVPIREITSLILERLIVDGKEVRRKRVFLSEKKLIDRRYTEEASEEEELRFINMGWYIERDIPKVGRIERLVYKSETGNTYKVEQYIIPYGSKEVFFTYRISIPLYEPGQGRIGSFDTESQTVKWTIEW